MFDSGDTSPYDLSFVVMCPYAPSVRTSAVSADKDVCKGVFAVVTALSWGFVRISMIDFLGVSSCIFDLNAVEQVTVDDGRVVVLQIMLGDLSRIFDSLMLKQIGAVGLLSQHVTLIFFVAKDCLQTGRIPFFVGFFGIDFSGRRNVSFVQAVADRGLAVACVVSFKDLSDDFGFVFFDFQRIIFLRFDIEYSPIAVNIGGKGRLAFGIGVPYAPSDVFAQGFRFRLGEVAHHGYHRFARFCQRIDIFLLEDDTDPKVFQLTDIFKTVDRVS